MLADRPALDAVGSPAHLRLAAEVAARSLTLVSDDSGLLPLDPGARVLAVMPTPTDLTPADTSSLQPAVLAAALRRHADSVTEVVVPIDPAPGDVDAVGVAAADHDVVVVGTIAADAHPGQADLVRRLMRDHDRVVTVALRTPFDLAAYPEAGTHVCTYSILPPSLEALADSLYGIAGFPGRLPAAIPGLYPRGHGRG
jgi:beta-N-acetylhexosaminidase